MLSIKKTITDKSAVFALAGRLDTVTAPELEQAFKESLSGITDLTLDFEKVDYIGQHEARQCQRNRSGSV